jgi:hydroxymethylpyrimidine pyrophosphatase-like HAD family hydrolase
MAQNKQQDKGRLQKVSVNCLSSDYDGTISPLKIPRIESRVPLQTRVALRQINNFLPISIITMKDLPFIIPRTPFAQAWSAIGGLEMQIGKRVLKRESLDSKLARILLALNYAKSHLTSLGVEIEEKQDSEGRIVAFCVDWRRAEEPKAAKQEADGVAAYCKSLELELIRYETQPFYDVYPVAPNKGWALQEMLDELAVKKGVLYMGDSKTDNSAFRAASVSLGVINDETPIQTLDCDYLVKYESVPHFLHMLLSNDLVFSSDFPMIKINHNRGRE